MRTIKETNQEKFLAAYATCGRIDKAAQIAEIDRDCHYDWMNAKNEADREEYRARFAAAKAKAFERLEDEMTRRAQEGLVRKKFTKDGTPIIDPETGKQYAEHEYSDTLAIFLAKALAPDKYRDNVQHTHTGEVTIKRVVLGGDE